MTKMYIANGSTQYHDFVYSLPESPAHRRQQIPPGGQIQISGDLNPIQVDSIVEQHRIYGMVRVSEVDRTKPFVGLCYELDKPIRLEKIANIIEHNRGVLVKRGEEIRRDAALSTGAQIENEIFERRMPDQLQTLEMSIQEETETRDPQDDSPTIAVGTRVTRRGDAAPLPPRRTRGRRGR